MIVQEGHCLKALQLFRQLNKTFEIIHGQARVAGAKRLLVLDSSFNPPHMGHYTLVKKALDHYKQDLHVLLLLSVNNADKPPKPATFDKRLEMMCLMAGMLQEENIPTSVGITVFGKFMDKSAAIQKDFCAEAAVVYLVGFDTVVRIFDPKYYKPQLPSEALREFMSQTELFCLTRDTGAGVQAQLAYCGDIAKGVYEPDIPRQWAGKVHVVPNDDRFSSVSSSEIRERIHDPSFDLTSVLPSPIINYTRAKRPGSRIFE